MITRVLAKKGATVRDCGMMYQAVDQSVLLYVSEICVVTGDMIKLLEGFRYRAARQIIWMTATRGAGGEWKYPPVVAALNATGIHPIR